MEILLMNIKLTERDVLQFLKRLNAIINAEDFNLDDNFILIKNSKEPIEFSTPYTLIDLEYDVDDVVRELSSLRVSDFSEARLDADDPNPPILMIFGKKINNREIYIKIKNRESEDLHQVICVSFHYSQWEMMYPYKN